MVGRQGPLLSATMPMQSANIDMNYLRGWICNEVETQIKQALDAPTWDAFSNKPLPVKVTNAAQVLANKVKEADRISKATIRETQAPRQVPAAESTTPAALPTAVR